MTEVPPGSHLHIYYTEQELEDAAVARRKQDKQEAKRLEQAEEARRIADERRQLSLKALADVAEDEAHPDRVKAANSLLAYYPRPGVSTVRSS